VARRRSTSRCGTARLTCAPSWEPRRRSRLDRSTSRSRRA
jgi:hypothetical protein